MHTNPAREDSLKRMNESTPPLALLRDGPPDAAWSLVLAHSAGLGMDAPFMAGMAERVAAAGVEVVRFEFPYMRVQRATARKRAPNAPRILLDSWREVIAALGDPSRLIIGGKSMGGRIASMVADEQASQASSCLATRSTRSRSPTGCAPATSRRCARPL